MKKKFTINDYNDNVDFRDYEPLTPMEAIKAYCKQCYCYDSFEMKKCNSYSCPFNQFLKRGFRGKPKNYSEETRERVRQMGLNNKKQ